MPKIEPFETYPDRYEAWFEEYPFVYKAEIEAVRRLLPEGTGLEVGVGTGRFAAPLGIRQGIEPSLSMGVVAQQRGVTVRQGVAEALPFSDARFDSVLMVTTVCFLDDVDLAFKEAHRVLKPGGAIVIGLIDRDSPLGKIYREHQHESLFYREATFHSADEAVACLSTAGFGDFVFAQTVFRDLQHVDENEPVREGYGEGSFVVIRGMK